jgi:prepilin-type N-terminal cleavage/methylation domain-containing protein
MPRGTTLPELLFALVILGVLAALTAPAAAALRDRLRVDEAAALVAEAHGRARLLATIERRVMVLTLTPDSVVLRAVETRTDTTERWRAAGPAASGVTVSGFPRTVGFAPSGVAFGFANGSYGFSRGAARKRVIVSRYGRVREE